MKDYTTIRRRVRAIVRQSRGVLFVLPMLLLLTSCEDAPPNSFVPVPYVEGYLFVDRPINGIVVATSQSLAVKYDLPSGMIADADVQISDGGASYQLAYRVVNGVGSYWYPDSTVLVKPATRYTLSVRLKSGAVLGGSTLTPERIEWTKPPRSLLQYPSDTVHLTSPDSLRIAWTPGNGVEYIIRAQCLDTLAYGAYLVPSTDEQNGRTNNFGQIETAERNTFYSTTRWGFVQATGVPTVWTAFRWYGRNNIAILSPDVHFLDWFKMTKFSGNPQYNPQFSNITGGTGIFASAAMVEKELFLLKRVK
jgi:hypothetical protein